ncbi:non-ribosomal peptide synthetase [Pantoea sp. 1.19]|uniref:non-ribosomal peptide synthetase n=1 Tax=Pantoea sp. 1.19 TaxID=1925589 RepID=UPI0009491287|nr:non-ribosomal peptide synthetase [Pantoea sp. 1.19]
MKPTPASPYTRLFWNEYLLDERGYGYNMLLDQTVTGPLDISRLAAAVARLVSDYPLMRSALQESDGVLYWVPARCTPALEIVADEGDPAAQVRAPFDLRRGPLCRFVVIKHSDDRHRILFVLHHIIVDGLSAAEFYQAIEKYYLDGDSASPPPQTHECRVQLARQFEKDIHTLKQQDASEQFWREILSGCPQRINLPYLPQGDQETQQNEIRFSLANSTWKGLSGHIKYVTPFLVFKTLWALLVARQSSQTDVVIGYPVAPAGGEPLYFGAQVNTAVFPFSLADGATFNQLYRQTLAYTRSLRASGGHRHSQLPTGDILANSPIASLQVNFTQAWLKDYPLQLPDCQAQINSQYNLDLAGSELLLEYQKQPDGFDFRLRFDPALFSYEQMADMAEQYLALMTQAMLAPDRPVSRFPLLTAQQYQRMNDRMLTLSCAPPAAEASLLSALLCEARRHPLRLALQDSQQGYDYQTLMARVGQVACRLRAAWHARTGHAMPADTLIPLLVPRGAEAIIALLGILQAGGAYVPLDPALPAGRLAYILKDVGSPLMVSETSLRTVLSETAMEAEVLYIDTCLADPLCVEEPLPTLRGEQLAYVIYTSGTTGRPKGTLCTHAGAANMVARHAERMGMTSRERLHCLQFASLAFDAHVFEVFLALSGGHSLYVVDEPARIDPSRLIDRLQAWQIGCCFLPPSLLATRPPLPACVRYVCVGGESTPQEILDNYAATGITLVNMYGPTEAAVSVSLNIYRGNGAQNIGRPIGNMRAYVLDEHRHLLPFGVEGELYLSGIGLARGYLHQPEMTERAFGRNPFSDEKQYARLYRTGDRVRQLTDGSLIYCGRQDQQVKIHGHRIELGEIESALRQLDGIREAVVAIDPQGRNRIHAWYVASSAASLSAEQIRQQLALRLPAYMLPAAIAEIATVPLTISKKVDYRALPEPTEVAGSAPYQAAETPMERALQPLFAALLPGRIGCHDPFFHVGGHSILAIRLCHEIERQLGYRISVATLHQHPTIRTLAACLERLPRAAEASPLRARHLPFGPLSLQQSRLWFIEQLETGVSHYLTPVALRLGAQVNIPAWKSSLISLVERHAVLRSLIHQDRDGEPEQYITSRTLTVTDATLPASEWRARVQAAMQVRMDLTTDLPVRAAIWHLTHDNGTVDTRALIIFHHSVFDGWSLPVMLKELAALYAWHCGQTAAPPAMPALQYLDYACWQREATQTEAQARSLTFWQQQLLDYQPLDFPHDFARRSPAERRGETLTFTLPASLSERIAHLTREHDLRPHALFLAGFILLLSRYCGQDDILVGMPLANRERPELDEMIGFFVNVLPMRCQLNNDDEVVAFVRRVADATLAMQAHQHLSLEQLLDALAVPRDFTQHPLFQVIFALEEEGEAIALPAGIGLLEPSAEDRSAKYDLTLTVQTGKGATRVRLNYDCGLLRDATLRHFADYYVSLLQQLVQGPHVPLGAIRLPTIVAPCNAGRGEGMQRLYDGFLQQARRDPLATAIVDADGAMTYGELLHAALTLATQLRAQGKVRGEAIALLLDKGRAQPVAMLAALFCGNAFLPMDSAWPAQRRREVMAMANSNTVLCHREWDCDGLNVVLLERDGTATELPMPDTLLPPCAVEAGDLAYIIFTSGSTGLPKGVAIEHHSAVTTLAATQRKFSLTAADRTLALSAFSFDLAIYDLFSPLSLGGACVMPAEADKANPAAWYALIVNQRVTSWLSAPALMELMLDYVQSQGRIDTPPPALRIVMLGGDWIGLSLPERLRRWAPKVRFYSAGGATETALFSILYEVPPGPILTKSIPYGTPLDGEAFYILDADLRPLPPGAVGEMFVAGSGLARGYYGDEARTAERFFWHDALATRLYRTGDKGRRLTDGHLEFMGRLDQQLKVNGYRIEPGEIENTLLACPGVTGCCVTLTAGAVPELGGWFTAAEPLDPARLETHLRQTLPDYMIPSFLLQIAQLPLTVNGKIARDRLPLPPRAGAAFVAPATSAERACAQIWSALLQRESISVTARFFALGGNSLLAIRACYRMRDVLQREISIHDLGRYPTIRQLCEGLNNIDPVTAPVRIPIGNADQHPLSASQQQLWFIENVTGGGSLYHVPMLFRLASDCDISAWVRSLQWLVARHGALRSQLVDGPDGHAMMALSDRPLSIRRREADETTLPRLLREEIDRPFDLRLSLPVRAVLYHTPQAKGDPITRCLLVFHHLAFDGWSQRLFMQEWLSGYDAFRRGQSPALAPPALQYGDYACWQQAQLASAAFQAHQTWWQQTLSGWQDLNLPTDFSRPPRFDHRGDSVDARLPATLVAQVERTARQLAITPFALYLGAFNVLLSLFSNQQDLIVGTPVANRPTPETEGVIGFFVNTLPLRSRLDDQQPIGDYLTGVFDGLMAAQAHQALPLSHIIRALQVPQDLSRNPLFQVLFTFEEDQAMPALPAWLQPEALGEAYRAAKFDLMLCLQRCGDAVSASLNFATALFHRDTMACLADYYQRILQHIVAAPAEPLRTITLLPDEAIIAERARWQQAGPAYDFQRPIHADFLQHAAQYPDDPAIVDARGTLTYGELYQAALTLSLQLRHHVADSGDTVAVLVDKGRAQVIAVLAIVMAGKAYLPMDRAWPVQRCQQVLEHSATRLAIVDRPDAGWAGVRPLLIDIDGRADLPPPTLPGQPLMPDPAACAYVIFTSGSTGTPKGVAVRHSGAVNTIVDTVRRLNLQRGVRGLAISALSFDISVFDLFGLLSCGGTMVMPGEEERYQPDAWYRLLIQHRIGFWNSTPTVMGLLADFVESDRPRPAGRVALRHAILVGEVIPKPLAARIRRFSPACRVFSTGGATESSIWSIIYEIPPGEIARISVPYGQAMTHQRFYILDRYQRPLPPGMPGEQYIGGAGVAEGYYRDPALTAERFIDHPLLGERLYRTGDAGRYLPEGNIEFMGRMDFQVKLQGHRIELQEIEHCVLQFTGIQACCAVVCSVGEQPILALYYVSAQPCDDSALQAHIARRLPRYMIPSSLNRLAALPYNASGKLDRKALPAPQATHRTVEAWVAPQTALEQQLCASWQTLLRVESIGMNDDFFQRGGTSILAISACVSLSSLLGREVPVVSLFEHRTIAKLLAAAPQGLIVPLNTVNRPRPTLWMIHPALVGTEVFFPLAAQLSSHLRCIGVDNYHLRGETPIAELSALARYYLREMRPGNGPLRILGWSLGGIIALEMAAQLEAEGVREIELYLLDSFYQQSVTASVDTDTLLATLGLEGEAASRARRIADHEAALAAQPLSQPLRHTRVTLFKALRANPALVDPTLTALIALDTNGLEAVCPRLSVRTLDCDHHTVLSQAEQIAAVLINAVS